MAARTAAASSLSRTIWSRLFMETDAALVQFKSFR